MNYLRYILMLTGIMLLCQACFEEDEQIPPKPSGNATEISFDVSIYENQVYFDLGSEEVRSVNENDSWQIAFGSEPEDWHVNVNSAALYAVAPTGTFSFEEAGPITSASSYIFDASSGDPDSCAFHQWLNRSLSPAEPTGEIFQIGKFDGIKYKPLWKIRINNVSETAFTISYSAMEGEVKDTLVPKDPQRSLVHVLLEPELQIVNIEPPKSDWDLLFTQYGTILYTNEGEPTPYFVRGTLQNPWKTSIARDTAMDFDSIDYFDAIDLEYSTAKDKIGYEWKDVFVDFESNTAVYKVCRDTTWIINDSEGLFYKLRFTNYYNTQTGEKGYPGFEYLKL